MFQARVEMSLIEYRILKAGYDDKTRGTTTFPERELRPYLVTHPDARMLGKRNEQTNELEFSVDSFLSFVRSGAESNFSIAESMIK